MDKGSEPIEKPEDIFISLDDDDISGKKRLSVERIYQRKTQLEHILLRPDTYVGSVEETTEPMYVYDEDKDAIIRRPVTFVPGLYKIFDEILVNAADNKQRDKLMNAMKINIKPEENMISVWNNGRGIPVEMHTTEKKYVPELIFGTLLTSSNYNDSQRKVTGGRNGYGAKLCNIFSSEFTVETSCNESKKSFKMTWTGNMGKSGKTIIKDSKSDYTRVTFKPDLSKFGMTHLTKDMVDIMTRRVYDMAGCMKGVAVYLNGKKLPVKSFKEYVELYVKGVAPLDEDGEELPRKVVHEVVSPRWEVAITASPGGGFQQASFVNSIATTKGGTHINYIVDQVVSKLLEVAKRKNKGGMDLKPFHIKNHLWVFVNCLIENPTFDSQTKENMTLKSKSFGTTCSLGDKFIKSAMSCGVVERVLNWARAKSQAQIAKKQSGSKSSKLRGIAKLDDANEAGGKNSLDCTLIVTEGDSAKSLAVSGLGVIGRDYYGVFPLRGKLLNVREATHNQIMGNEEIKNIVKIMGLQYNKKYSDSAELRTLRYGRLMIMADQDQDGSHIKGLVINFIHHNWPKLLRQNFVEEFITPIVKVTKSKNEVPFYSLPEFENWKSNTENSHTWKVKYYKGLGTSTSKEAKEYFSDMERHRIPFKYAGPEDDEAIVLAFSKKCIEQRKEWLSSWLREKKQRRQEGLNESFLYGEETDHISYSMFINKELILFSNADNERSIPSMVDGLKPGQRKVLFTCFKRNDKKDVKVAQLAGSVAEHSAYHHGEASLMSTIINLAHNFVGSNNISLLQPIGQFGTRLHGGKDAASPRYIFTMLSPLTRLLFPTMDDPQLSYIFEDNIRIEPEWYCPILPMVLVNGGEGIGTGYSTSVPNFNVRDIVANIKRMMSDIEPIEMTPCYKNFVGAISHVEPTKYSVYGNISRLSPTSLEITELPIRSWTQSYKENVLEPMLHGNEKMQPFITDYKEYHTDTTVRFVVTLSTAKMDEAEKVGFHKKFKIEGSISTANMVLFDSEGCLKRYSSANPILSEFYEIRLKIYQKRMDYLVGMLSAESAKLTNQARFILEKIEGKISIENKKKAVMIGLLKSQGYKSDPVKVWKASIAHLEEQEKDGNEEEEGGEGGEVAEKDDYSYLFSLPLLSLTREKKEELLKNRDAKIEELRILQEKTPKDLWNEDIDNFMKELDHVEEIERNEDAAGAKITVKKNTKSKGKSLGRQTKLPGDKNSLKHTKPSPFAEVIEPVIPVYNANPKKPGAGRAKKEILQNGGGGSKTKEGSSEIAPAKSIKDSFNFSNGGEEEEEEEVTDLATRLARKRKSSPSSITEDDPKQKKIPFKPRSKTALDLTDSESDSDLDNNPPPPKLVRPARPKAASSAYVEAPDDSDSVVIENIDSESDFIDEFNSDDDFISVPPKNKRPNVVKPKVVKNAGVKVHVTTAKTNPSKKPTGSSAEAVAVGVVDLGSSSEDEVVPVQRARKGARNVLEDTLSGGDDDVPPVGSDGKKETSPKKKKITAKAKPVTKKKTAAKPPVKKASKGGVEKGQAMLRLKAKPKPKKVSPIEVEVEEIQSGDSFDELLPPVTKRIKKVATKNVVISDESDFSPDYDNTITITKSTKSRPTRQRGKVKYNFNEDEEDDDDYVID